MWGRNVASSVHSLFMDITSSLCVPVMLHTVITSTAVYSIQEVRFLTKCNYCCQCKNDQTHTIIKREHCMNTIFNDRPFHIFLISSNT